MRTLQPLFALSKQTAPPPKAWRGGACCRVVQPLVTGVCVSAAKLHARRLTVEKEAPRVLKAAGIDDGRVCRVAAAGRRRVDQLRASCGGRASGTRERKRRNRAPLQWHVNTDRRTVPQVRGGPRARSHARLAAQRGGSLYPLRTPPRLTLHHSPQNCCSALPPAVWMRAISNHAPNQCAIEKLAAGGGGGVAHFCAATMLAHALRHSSAAQRNDRGAITAAKGRKEAEECGFAAAQQRRNGSRVVTLTSRPGCY